MPVFCNIPTVKLYFKPSQFTPSFLGKKVKWTFFFQKQLLKSFCLKQKIPATTSPLFCLIQIFLFFIFNFRWNCKYNFYLIPLLIHCYILKFCSLAFFNWLCMHYICLKWGASNPKSGMKLSLLCVRNKCFIIFYFHNLFHFFFW